MTIEYYRKKIYLIKKIVHFLWFVIALILIRKPESTVS